MKFQLVDMDGNPVNIDLVEALQYVKNNTRVVDIGKLVWTQEPPTTEGYYWVFNPDDGFPVIVEVQNVNFISEPIDLVVIDLGRECGFDEFEFWLGPLPMPEPPQE